MLEPQPWSSYRKGRAWAPEMRAHAEALRLLPHEFPAYLRRAHGLELERQVAHNARQGGGIIRDVLVFRKPAHAGAGAKNA